ncbi:phosphohydrolase [Acidovorax sp. SRB_14]|uniref:HD-GYP domain-containing protein n=1 Tax=Acidovorax sp. SRB_14 TaxID=1962699 RepID=UPI001565E6FF|nr:phosphohydrolase [Acidovorax sp. SRB_14]NMM81961.1 phosphohydrolase [Acidovorax sp. SRB_14]
MNLLPLNIDSLQLGQPLPFVLRGASGAVLAHKGYVIRTRAELDALVRRGVDLCVDTDESGDSHRAYLAQLQRMLLSQKPLGQIASMQMAATAQAASAAPGQGLPDWPELQLRATQLLRSPQLGDFGARFTALHACLAQRCQQAPDASLLALVHLSAQETDLYSATHGLLVGCVGMVVARATLQWSEAQVLRVGRAALSMNIAMTALQDQLAQQTEPLDAQQIAAVEGHALRSESLLRQLGVNDPVWLEAVRLHHHRSPGPLAAKSEAQQLARLLQRTDIFAARMAPRATRAPMPVTAAMQACYYDEAQQVDEAGAAIVKTLGIYPPGAFVRLASHEVGVVLKRGATATTPRVAVLLNREGLPTGEMIPRDTAQAAWKITGAVAQRDVRVNLSLDRLLAMV